MATAYKVRQSPPADAEREVLRVWTDNLDVECDPGAKFRWTFREPPNRPPSVFLLDAAGDGQSPEVVGTASVGERDFRIGDRRARAALLSELAVDRAHRSLFPAMRLVREVRRVWPERCDFAYGFPNDKAEKLFLRCGYQTLGRITRYARPLRHAPFLRRWRDLPVLTSAAGAALDAARLIAAAPAAVAARARYRLAWDVEVDDRFDALWDEAGASYRVIAARTAEFLRWRFLRHPETRYRLVAMSEGDALRAYAVTSEVDGGCHVHDLFGAPAALGALLDLAIPALYAGGARSVSVEFLGDPRIVALLGARGFRARKSARAVIVGGPAELGDPTAWFITDADHEWW